MTNSQTILVVDDDPRWRQIVADVLADAGYKTVLAPAAPSPLPPCQAAVVDVSLDSDDSGNRDGLALAAKLGPIPVILLSGAPESEIAEFARTRPHIAGHIEKSAFRKEALLALLGARAGERRSAERRDADPDRRGRSRAGANIYSDILGESGYELQFAVSYGEARGLLQRARFQAAVVDLHLVSSSDPEENRDGFALLRVAGTRNLPTIVVSALGAPDDIDRAYDEFGVFRLHRKGSLRPQGLQADRRRGDPILRNASRGAGGFSRTRPRHGSAGGIDRTGTGGARAAGAGKHQPPDRASA